MNAEPIAVASAPPPSDERIFRLTKPNWTVVQAAASDSIWLRGCVEFCPGARYVSFPRRAEDRAAIVRELGSLAEHVELRDAPLGRAEDASGHALDRVKAE